MFERRKTEIDLSNSIFGILILVLFFVALFFIARGIFTILSWLAPILLIVALLLDYKTVIGYLKYILKLFQRNPLFGLGATLLTIFGYPIVAGFLAVKAFFNWKVRRMEKEQEEQIPGEYIDYEEVDQEPLPPLKEKEKEKVKESKDNQYDQLFD